MKRIIYHYQVEFIPVMQRRFDIQKVINVIHINRMKKNANMTFSVDAINSTNNLLFMNHFLWLRHCAKQFYA